MEESFDFEEEESLMNVYEVESGHQLGGIRHPTDSFVVSEPNSALHGQIPQRQVDQKKEQLELPSPVIKGSDGVVGINFDFPLEKVYQDLADNHQLSLNVMHVLTNAMTLRGKSKTEIVAKLESISSEVSKYRK